LAVRSAIQSQHALDHKERIEHKETAEESQIGGVFVLFVFYVVEKSLEFGIPAIK
jgi:hypothetical protein